MAPTYFLNLDLHDVINKPAAIEATKEIKFDLDVRISTVEEKVDEIPVVIEYGNDKKFEKHIPVSGKKPKIPITLDAFTEDELNA